MKHTISKPVRSKRSAARSSKQAPKSKPATGTVGEAESVRIVLHREDGGEWEHFDLPAERFALLEAVCQRDGITVPEFLVRAVEAKVGFQISRPGLTLCEDGPSPERVTARRVQPQMKQRGAR